MFKSKELFPIAIITLILAVIISLLQTWNYFFYILIAIFIIIIANILAKKIASYYLDSEIEIKLWDIKRFGFRPENRLKNAFPAGAFFPIILSAFSAGILNWMACLTFEVKPKIYRAAKRHGLYSFSEMTEYHLGLIAAAGILINLFLAIVGYFLGFPLFAKLNVYYALFNMIPISDLDGNKIFFGSLILWTFLATITLIGLAYVFLLI